MVELTLLEKIKVYQDEIDRMSKICKDNYYKTYDESTIKAISIKDINDPYNLKEFITKKCINSLESQIKELLIEFSTDNPKGYLIYKMGETEGLKYYNYLKKFDTDNNTNLMYELTTGLI
jgi:hypothetical protein